MEWLFIASVCAVSVGTTMLTSALLGRLRHRESDKPTDTLEANVWMLPPPGGDAQLYRRLTTLLNSMAADRAEAVRQRDLAIAERDALIEEYRARDAEREIAKATWADVDAEYRIVMAKLETANRLVKQWTHSGMRIA